MDSLEIWNKAVEQKEPFFSQLRDLFSGIEFNQVFHDDFSLWNISQNVFIELQLGITCEMVEKAPIVNIIFPLKAKYFEVPINDQISMKDYNLTWIDLKLPCAASSLLEVLKNDGKILTTATESDLKGHVVRWKIYYSSMTFTLIPLMYGEDNPIYSELQSIEYSFRIPYGGIRPPKFIY